MKKGKVVKIQKTKIYLPFEKKSLEERGVRIRATVFSSKRDYSRSKMKSALRKEMF